MLVINIIKKHLLVVVIPIANTCISLAQSYYHSPNDTIISNANFDDVSVYNITQVHPLNDTILFKYHKYSVAMPTSWDAYLCDNTTCHPDMADSSNMWAIPGDNGLMSLHLNPHFEAGTGIIRYLFFDTNTPLQVDTLTWIISAGATDISTLTTENPCITIINQTLSLKNVVGRFDKLRILDMNGRIIYQAAIEKNEHFTMPYFQTPVIIVQLGGYKILYQQKMNTLNR
jgi:hypothetical protein